MEESINTDNYLQEFSCRATVRAELKNSFGIEELNIDESDAEITVFKNRRNLQKFFPKDNYLGS